MRAAHCELVVVSCELEVGGCGHKLMAAVKVDSRDCKLMVLAILNGREADAEAVAESEATVSLSLKVSPVGCF